MSVSILIGAPAKLAKGRVKRGLLLSKVRNIIIKLGREDSTHKKLSIGVTLPASKKQKSVKKFKKFLITSFLRS